MDLSNTQTFNGMTTISGGPSKRRGVDMTGRVVLTPAVLLTTTSPSSTPSTRNTSTRTPDIDYSGQPVFNTSTFVGNAAI